MVIYDVQPGPRDNYKIWEEQQIPKVIFEVTSAGTREQDQGLKKGLYEQLGVQEYWLFDPRGEWIPEQLQGYRLQGERYQLIDDRSSAILNLRLEVEQQVLVFYRQDTGAKLLLTDELGQKLQSEILARQQAEARAQSAEDQVAILRDKLRALGIDPDSAT
jgi:Putative restriction endonuclease